MYYALLILFVIAVIILWETRQKKITFKSFLLTTRNSKERHDSFLESYDTRIPLEIIYSEDTRKPIVAQKFKKLIDDDYYKKAMKLYFNPRMLRPDITYFNLGAIGCYMGHLEFHRRAASQGLKYAVIFEDNVIIKSKRVYEEIQKVIDEKGDDFEMCFFHCLSRLPESKEGDLEKVRWISSTKCYLVHVPNVQKYLDEFLPMNNHVDMKHEDLIAKGARIYYKDLRHCMIIDRTHRSTIGHSRHGNDDFFSKQYPHLKKSRVLIPGY
jgi:GR25 family glycosyltransferase involved in LPS biosynthesis